MNRITSVLKEKLHSCRLIASLIPTSERPSGLLEYVVAADDLADEFGRTLPGLRPDRVPEHLLEVGLFLSVCHLCEYSTSSFYASLPMPITVGSERIAVVRLRDDVCQDLAGFRIGRRMELVPSADLLPVPMVHHPPRRSVRGHTGRIHRHGDWDGLGRYQIITVRADLRIRRL